MARYAGGEGEQSQGMVTIVHGYSNSEADTGYYTTRLLKIKGKYRVTQNQRWIQGYYNTRLLKIKGKYRVTIKHGYSKLEADTGSL